MDSLYVYGDLSYGMSNHLIGPYQASTSGLITLEMKGFNKKARVSAEGRSCEAGLQKNDRQMGFLVHEGSTKDTCQPYGQYRVATPVTNMHSCLHVHGGNQISRFSMSLEPPR